jgi:putative ABC transport system permease protein
MFRNYLKIIIRQLLKQKMYSIIKIGGFAMSITACILITLFIRNELSYDKHYPAAERIYRVVGLYKNNGKLEKGTAMPAPMAKTLEKDFPEIEKAGRLMSNKLFGGAGENQLRRVERKDNTYETGFCFADQAMIDILSIPILQGDGRHALTEPNTMVISKRKAEKYFPGENPVGKVMILDNRERLPIKIGGVMADPLKTSHLPYDFYISLAGIAFWEGEQDNWLSSNYDNYVLLKPGTDREQFEKKMSSGILKNYMIPSMKRSGNKFTEDVNNNASLQLQPVTDIHLRSNDIRDNLSHGDIRFVWLFGSVAAFILLIACINFINLSTARSANRAKEVGLRKVAGSGRKTIITQFLLESTIFSILSFLLALFLAQALMPLFNNLSQKTLSIPWGEWWFIPILAVASVIVGVLAGIYPSFYLSAFKPVQVLKGQLSKGSKSAGLRNALVVFQFTASIILIIGTFVIYSQTNYILHSKTGFDKDQVVVVEGTHTLGQQVQAFKQEVKKLPNVTNASVSDYLPVSGTKRNGNTFWNDGKQKEESGAVAQKWVIDEDYIATMGMKLLQGRNFSRELSSDSQAIIINKTMVAKLGLKDPIGKRIDNGTIYTVIGAVDDFNFESMRENIDGLCMVLGSSPSMVAVKVNSQDMRSVVAAINTTWKSFSPNQQMRYSFLDESFARMYADVQRMQSLFISFAVLAIIIACLGLFALSAYMAEQRSKEIGIRKVLGASVTQITSLLSRDFVRLVLIAILIASPIAWWAMHKWLQDFAYRIDISWWMFAGAGLLVVVIALLTVSSQAIKAAVANPIKSLRTE